MYSPYLNVCSSARLRVHAFPQNPNDIFRLSMFSRIALRFRLSMFSRILLNDARVAIQT